RLTHVSADCPPSSAGDRLGMRNLHDLKLEPRVADVDLIAGPQLNAAHLRRLQAAGVAKNAGAASASRIEEAELAAVRVVADMGVLARHGCLRVLEGHVVAPAETVLFSHHLFQTADVHSLRVNRVLRGVRLAADNGQSY